MSASNAGPGGVRNLRAMFENKASDLSTSPPSRGRSPNGSISSQQERPLSKVRASFVAVEKIGEEEAPTAPAVQPTMRQPLNNTMDGVDEDLAMEEQNLGSILKGSPFVDEGIFETVPASTTTSKPNGVADRAHAMAKKLQHSERSTTASDKPLSRSAPKVEDTKVPQTKPKSKPSTDALKSPVEAPKPSSLPKGPVVKPKGGITKIKGIIESAARAREANAATAQQEESKVPLTPQTKEEPPSIPKEEDSSISRGIKPKGGVSKIKGIMESAAQAREQHNTAPKALGPDTTGQKENVKSSTASKPPRMSLPVRKLPAAVTAPTASSVAKTDDHKTTDPRPAERGTTKVTPRVASMSKTASLAKKSSRASLSSNDGHKPRAATRPADESFLARMTRPTASSAQKAHEKVQPVSPPRQKSSKTLAVRPSRASLSLVDDNKENEAETSSRANVPHAKDEKTESEDTQQAEVSMD